MVSDKGILTCLDAKTGRENWSERIGGGYSSSLLFADGKIYVQSEDGPAIVFKPGTNFEKLADAGFKSSAVYWETEHKGEGTGEYIRSETGDNAYSWIAYVVVSVIVGEVTTATVPLFFAFLPST